MWPLLCSEVTSALTLCHELQLQKTANTVSIITVRVVTEKTQWWRPKTPASSAQQNRNTYM